MFEPKLCECGCGLPTKIPTRNCRTYGDVKGQPRRFRTGHHFRRPLAERFAEKVMPANDLSPNGMDGCLVWTGYRDAKGYGRTSFGGSTNRAAHRAAWLLAGRVVPDGLELDHLCCRRACVNVDHLEAVTHAENMHRAAIRRRMLVENTDKRTGS